MTLTVKKLDYAGYDGDFSGGFLEARVITTGPFDHFVLLKYDTHPDLFESRSHYKKIECKDKDDLLDKFKRAFGGHQFKNWKDTDENAGYSTQQQYLFA